MDRTANVSLPLVQAAQAQKHVTVNEAFALLDAASQLVIETVQRTAPPVPSTEGAAYHVPPGASGDWAGQTGKLAVASNGGWQFVTPKTGWTGWIRDQAGSAIFDGAVWQRQAVAVSPNGAASLHEVVEVDVTVTPGSSVTTADIIPDGSVVFGVSGVVTEALTGSLSSWRVGVPDGEGRYGAGLGVALGSWVQGITGQPQGYYAPTPLVLEAEGGAFAAGRVRLSVHLFRMTIPRV